MLVSKFRRTQHSGDRKKVVQRSKFDPNIKTQRNAAGRVKSPGEAKRQNLKCKIAKPLGSERSFERQIFHMIIADIYMMISRFQIKSERINSFVRNMKNSPSYFNDFLTTIVLR